jgi:uncharacterized membrane protein YciS (DUF1049 family)
MLNKLEPLLFVSDNLVLGNHAWSTGRRLRTWASGCGDVWRTVFSRATAHCFSMHKYPILQAFCYFVLFLLTSVLINDIVLFLFHSIYLPSVYITILPAKTVCLWGYVNMIYVEGHCLRMCIAKKNNSIMCQNYKVATSEPWSSMLYPFSFHSGLLSTWSICHTFLRKLKEKHLSFTSKCIPRSICFLFSQCLYFEV